MSQARERARCGHCDRPAPRLAECGSDACTLMVCPACMTCDGLCLPCGDELAAAAHYEVQRRLEERDTLMAIASGATVAGVRLPLISQAR